MKKSPSNILMYSNYLQISFEKQMVSSKLLMPSYLDKKLFKLIIVFHLLFKRGVLHIAEVESQAQI